jgi:hypothetical protein
MLEIALDGEQVNMSDVAIRSKVEVARPLENGVAFGETFGLGVPTIYTAEIHDAINVILAADSVLTPKVLGMSSRTVWFCRVMAGMLILTRSDTMNLELRQNLAFEAGAGLLLILLALRGMLSRNIFERLYLFIAGVAMVGNSLMTQVDS